MNRRAHQLLAALAVFASGCGGYAEDSGASDSGGASGGSDPAPGGGDGDGDGDGDSAPGQLTAGDWDDNANFDFFLDSLDELRGQADLPAPDLADRVVITMTDESGAPLAGVTVRVASEAGTHLSALTARDGRVLFFPGQDGAPGDAALRVAVGSERFDAPAGSDWTFVVPSMESTAPVGLDVAFVIDATGSMSDEMAYVTAEVADIAAAVQAASGEVSLRFALVVYRDHGDAYVTRTTDFTRLGDFEAALADQSAAGGGDYPEAMDEALRAMNGLAWRDGNVARVAFLIADAPPHDNRAGELLEQVDASRKAGIKIYPVAASGVAQEAEYLMRLAAQATLARYMFLTDDSGIGNPHDTPLIPCYQVQRLNGLLRRALQSELTGNWIPPEPDDVIRSVGEPQDGVCIDGEATYHLW